MSEASDLTVVEFARKYEQQLTDIPPNAIPVVHKYGGGLFRAYRKDQVRGYGARMLERKLSELGELTCSRTNLGRMLQRIKHEASHEKENKEYSSWLRELPDVLPASGPLIEQGSEIRDANTGKKIQLGGHHKTNSDGTVDVIYTGQAGQGGKLRNPEEILESIGINPDRYIVTIGEMKGYQGYVKGPNKLPITIDLYSYKAKLEERAIPLSWTPSVLEWLPAGPSVETDRAETDDVQTMVFIGDAHFGFKWEDGRHKNLIPMHDRVALDAVRQYVAWRKPDIMCYAGDYLDNAALGRHDHDPLFKQTLTPSAWELGWFFTQMWMAMGGRGRHCLTPGNHDVRAHRMIASLIPELANYVGPGAIGPANTFEHLLGNVIEQTNLEIARDKHLGEEHGAGFMFWGDAEVPVFATHGRALGATGVKLVEKILSLGGDFHEVFGHAHKRAMASKSMRTRNGPKTITAACPGSMCHIDGRVPAQKNGKTVQNWQSGMVIGTNWRGKTSLSLIPIEDGVLISPEGKVFVGQDRSEEIAAAIDIPAINGCR